MLLKSREVCRLKDKCPHIGVGLYSCFGVKEGRFEEFDCSLVDERGNFLETECKGDINGTKEV